MKRLLTALVLFSTLFLPACASDDNASKSASDDDFVMLEGTAVTPASDAMANAWLNDTYLSRLASYPGLMKSHRFSSLGGPGADSFPNYFAVYHLSTEAALRGLQTSTQLTQATSELGTAWPNGDITMQWRAAFTVAHVTDNGNSSGTLPYVTIVPLRILPEQEATVTNWEDTKHVPWVAKYQGIAKVVRYQKVAGAGFNEDALLPKFVELFYFRDKAAFDAFPMDENFTGAEADRMATWKNGELSIDWVVSGEETFVK